jgi:hypothetical protein
MGLCSVCVVLATLFVLTSSIMFNLRDVNRMIPSLVILVLLLLAWCFICVASCGCANQHTLNWSTSDDTIPTGYDKLTQAPTNPIHEVVIALPAEQQLRDEMHQAEADLQEIISSKELELEAAFACRDFDRCKEIDQTIKEARIQLQHCTEQFEQRQEQARRAALVSLNMKPEFDASTGVPLNDSARLLCARIWTSSSKPDDRRDDFDVYLRVGEQRVRLASRVGDADLQAATNGFAELQKIGGGGSSSVYNGTLYGVKCAIKVLSEDASSWEVKQYGTEVDALSRITHENICRLYACATDGPRRCLGECEMSVEFDTYFE